MRDQKQPPVPLVNAELVRCRRFELADQHNTNIVAFMDVVDHQPIFVLCNGIGRRAIEIRTGKDSGAEICLIGENYTSRLGLALTKNGNALISILDAEGRERYRLEVDPHGQVSVRSI